MLHRLMWCALLTLGLAMLLAAALGPPPHPQPAPQVTTATPPGR